MALLTNSDLRALPQYVEGESYAAVIAYAEALVARYIGLSSLAVTAYSERRDIGLEQDVLLLHAAPVVIDSTHAFALSEGYTAPTALTRDTDYMVDMDTGIVRRLGGFVFCEGVRMVLVQYSAGYTDDTLPADLRGALVDLVGWRLDSIGARGATRESVDGYSVDRETLVRGIPESIASALQPWASGGLG